MCSGEKKRKKYCGETVFRLPKVLLVVVGLLIVMPSGAGKAGIIEIRKNPQPQTSDVVVLPNPVIITNLFVCA